MADSLSFTTVVGRPRLAFLRTAAADVPSPTPHGPTIPHPSPANVQTANDSRPTATAAQPRNAFERTWRRILEVLGYAGPSRSRRRELVYYLAFLVLCLAQVCVIVILTALAAVRDSPDPQKPGQSQLGACSLLGAWNLIWLVRLVVKCYLESWLYIQRRRSWRARRARLQGNRPHASDSGTPPGAAGIPVHESPPSPSDPVCPLTFRAFHILLYKLDPFVAIIWFFSAILIIYAHGSRCRASASDVSAATYTILIVVYAHFVLTTLIPMVRTMILRRRIGPTTIDKLSRAEVDRIPLVLYIPPPPEDAPTSPITSPPRALSHPQFSPRSAPKPSSKSRRFILFRPSLKRRKTTSTDVELGDQAAESPTAIEDGDEWDRMWEPAPYPFVRLPENRATCGICLSEFEAPRRLNGRDSTDDGVEAHEMVEVRVECPRPADARTVQFAEEGSSDAPEPLRLLGCGHVYHKDCVDQWLTQKSGRCPYCQARVEVPPAPNKSRKGCRRGTV